MDLQVYLVNPSCGKLDLSGRACGEWALLSVKEDTAPGDLNLGSTHHTRTAPVPVELQCPRE